MPGDVNKTAEYTPSCGLPQNVREEQKGQAPSLREDETRFLPVGNGALLARTARGGIAIAPRHALGLPEVRSAAIVLVDEWTAFDDGLPRLPAFSSHYLRAGTEHPLSFHGNGSEALARGLRVLLDIRTYRVEAFAFEGVSLGAFSFVEPCRERIAALGDAQAYLETWYAHAGVVLRMAAETVKELQQLEQLQADWKAFAGAAAPFYAFCRGLDAVFRPPPPHVFQTWEYAIVSQEIAKLNNMLTLVSPLWDFGEDSTLEDVQMAKDMLMRLFDPVDHVARVFVAHSDIADWLHVHANTDSPGAFSGRASAQLRFLIDEIAYHAGRPENGVRKSIVFEFEGDRIAITDTSDGKALAPFEDGAPTRRALENMAREMGHGTRIEFHDELGEDGMLMLRSLDITAPAERNDGPSGAENDPSKGRSTFGSDSAPSLPRTAYEHIGTSRLSAELAVAGSQHLPFCSTASAAYAASLIGTSALSTMR